MTDRACVPVIPFDGDSAPSRSDDGALIGGASFPANAVANFEKSGLMPVIDSLFGPFLHISYTARLDRMLYLR